MPPETLNGLAIEAIDSLEALATREGYRRLAGRIPAAPGIDPPREVLGRIDALIVDLRHHFGVPTKRGAAAKRTAPRR